MKVNIELNRNDYAHFFRYHLLKRRLKHTLLMFGLMTTGLPLLWIEDAFDLNTYIRDVVFCLVFFTLFYILSLVILFKVSLFFPAKKGFFLGKKTILLSEEGIAEQSENQYLLHQWKAVESIESDKQYIYVFINNIAHVIPKRAFQDPEEQERFVKEMEGHLNRS